MSIGRTGPGRDPDPDDLTPFEGWTFATDSDGDLRYTEMNRLAVARDAHAVRQCLLTAIVCVKGEDPLDPEFGLDRFTATRSTAHLKRELARVLLHDSKDHERVEQVNQIRVYTDGSRDALVRITVTLDTGNVQVFNFSVGGVL